jgi:hypothetical protein
MLLSQKKEKLYPIFSFKIFPFLLSHHIPMFLIHSAECIEREERHRTEEEERKTMKSLTRATRVLE